jgi:hypothetical protein
VLLVAVPLAIQPLRIPPSARHASPRPCASLAFKLPWQLDAETGSVCPQLLAADPFGVFALVMTPTRELAMQLADQFRALGAGMPLKAGSLLHSIAFNQTEDFFYIKKNETARWAPACRSRRAVGCIQLHSIRRDCVWFQFRALGACRSRRGGLCGIFFSHFFFRSRGAGLCVVALKPKSIRFGLLVVHGHEGNQQDTVGPVWHAE